MCTHHKERKKGLATSLLGTIEEYIANYKEKKELELTVPGGKNYSKLLSFYQKRGFEVTESQFWQWADMIKTCQPKEIYGTPSSEVGQKRKASTDPDQ